MNSASGWNYRVVKRTVGDETQYGIHEMFYNPEGWTENPVPIYAETLEGLRTELRHVLRALDEDVVDGDLDKAGQR